MVYAQPTAKIHRSDFQRNGTTCRAGARHVTSPPRVARPPSSASGHSYRPRFPRRPFRLPLLSPDRPLTLLYVPTFFCFLCTPHPDLSSLNYHPSMCQSYLFSQHFLVYLMFNHFPSSITHTQRDALILPGLWFRFHSSLPSIHLPIPTPQRS